MADALISVLLRQLASIAYQQIENEVRLVFNVEKEVAQITSNLKAIQAVLEDAEKRQVKEAIVRDWLEKLKDVSYEMDGVLDEWNTEFLRQQVEKQGGGGKDALVAKKKVCFSIPFHCFCFNQVSRVILRRDIALKIKDLNDRLNEIAKERQKYNFHNTEKGIEHRPESSSFVDISKTFGRENEKGFIVSKLLSESSVKGSDPLVIPIVGMGGIGKTTLAQLVYNDESIKSHFETRIWVCVSDPFDVIKIAKAIIDGNGTPNSDGLEAFLQCMSKSVDGKRFLLVLDDVWTQDHREWEQLKLPLQKGSTGSRILVTTRKEEVTIMMGVRISHMIHLKELSEACCWSLFCHIAFFDRGEDESDEFEAIGKEIIKKCKGLPLAAKALGSLMRFKKTRKEWEDVLHSKIWELEEIEQEVFQPLLLSYYDLASAVRHCLLYCVIFPKDYVFEKNYLIELWMSQDYLNLEEDKNKGIVGQNYFNNLVMRSFFQDFNEDDGGNVTVKMHDIVHDFVQFLTKKEAFIIEVKNPNKGIEVPKVRHLTLMLEDPFGIGSHTSLLAPVSSENCKNMRTLATFGSRITTLDPDFISQLKGIRTLSLSNNEIEELPKEIGELIHLRYVDLSGNYPLVELPNTMCNLYNLQTLRLNWCPRLAKLPKDMDKLISLKHLHVKGCDELKYLPKGIGRLTSLRVLDGFRVCGVSDNDTFKLGELRLLDKLEGRLVIKELGNVTDASEVEKAQLWNKKHILHLELDFWNGDGERDGKSDVEILNVLQGPQNLEYLRIRSYFGTISPNWTSLHSLRSLILYGWRYCEVLPPLGKLPSLEILTIRNMDSLRKVGVEFLGIEETQTLSTILFPKLKQLGFSRIPKWEEWEGVGGSKLENSEIVIMPCLSLLYISRAYRLRTLPDFLWKTPLHELGIFKCSEVLEQGFMKRHKIPDIPNIKINYRSVRKEGVWIQEYVETEERDRSDFDEGDDEIVQE